MTRLRIAALEPYYGGSHRAVLDGLVASTDADWTLLTLPARKWKWRMRGAAITMADELARLAREDSHDAPFDLLFASTFLNLAEFRGLAPEVAALPAIVYFHENQLVYPNRHTAEWDLQFPLTNITSALSADTCVFNSKWNRDEFLAAIPAFIKQFPDHHPADLVDRIERKTVVLAPPFDPTPFDSALSDEVVDGPRGRARVRIVWPHRWEHDKNPEEFFSAVGRLAQEGLDFEVVVAGQSFRETEQAMRGAANVLGDRLVHCEQPSSIQEYAKLLVSADIAVSTAINEFFGLAMIEACYAGCAPLVPDRLAYQELYPAQFRYADEDELVRRLRELVVGGTERGGARHIAEKYTFGALSGEYESLFSRVAFAGPQR